ncbi:conserved hypothetical protein [Enhydrobacter sp. 8BJ]|nr:conserved hypothetical protein [Enhydrobacter sp. 8BJ]
MTQPTPTELIIKLLTTLSNDLHQKIDNKLVQIKDELQQHSDITITKKTTRLSELLLTKLSEHIDRQIEQKTQQHNQQITDYLDELKKLQTAEIATLKKGQEEFQLLQDKIQSTLSHLDSIQPVDESKFESSLTDLKNSIQTLKTSTSESNSEQQSLESLISELETLKTDMTKTLASLKQQQQALADSLLQFQPLLKP